MKTTTNNRAFRRDLNGKTVVITGASSGVGRAAALEFARCGAMLVLAARRVPALDELVRECEQFGAIALAVETDVTDAAAVKRLADKAADFGGRIDVWINNAGVLAAGSFTDTPVEVHSQVIKTNLLGYLNGAHAALPYFKNQQSGVLINNISVGGWLPTPYGVGYAASKFGLRGFSEALSAELHAWPGIHVCDLFPAFLDTPGIQHAGNYTGHEIKPAPPVYDPKAVALAMVSLARYPKRALTVGNAATMLRLAHFFLPALTLKITAKVMEGYFKVARPTPATNGNLFEPVEYGTSIYGGWNQPATTQQKKLTAALFITGLAAGFLLAAKRKR